ncbi:MAG: twin-arginine translocation signal domain-containing protein [Verrucomicrobiota bacterium]|jgi:hypothetical protein
MPRENSGSARPGQTRRQFLKKTGAGTLAVAGAGMFQLPFSAQGHQSEPSIALVLDAADPLTKTAPVQWAAGQLRDALAARGFPVQSCSSPDAVASGQTAILVAGRTSLAARQVLDAARISLPDAPECLALVRGQAQNHAVILAAGSDERGLVYALLELADRVNFAGNPLQMLQTLPPVSERPANRIRSISRSFVSDVEDKPWFQNRDFWPAYLTLLAAHRFNRFNLALGIGYDFTTGIRDCYFHFAYPFLLAVPGYDVRANPLPEAERDRNLQMLRFISDETDRRGLHFQLGLWTHAYQWTQSPNANYTIEGLTPATHALYCRDALRALLTACPAISGVTFRIHGESGVPEGNYDLWKTIFDGAAQCGRRVEIDMHAKGMDQGMIDTALGTGLPVNISPKFWAEHMGLPYMQGAIRPQEMPPRNARATGVFKLSSGARQFLRYGYGDLLTEDRRYGVLHRIWPGAQRLLLWGDPQTAAAYGRVAGFCGSSGLEIFEPLFFKGRKGSGLPGGRDGYADLSLRAAGGDFEKYRYTYRLWGRSLYNPDGDPDAWRRLLRHQFGRGAEKVEQALACASRILPLVTTAHCPSAANNTYWPEIYTHMPLVNENRPHPYTDTPSPRRLGTVSPLDPEFFLGIDEFAKELLASLSVPKAGEGGPAARRSGKYSPAWVAQQLDEFAASATANLREAKSKVPDPRAADFRRLAADITVQAGLGRFFAAKFRSGLLLALYVATGHRPALQQAIKANRASRDTWAKLAEQAKDIYRSDLTFGYDKNVRGHWLDRLPALEQDIADMEKLLETQPSMVSPDPKITEKSIRDILSPPPRADAARLAGFHTPPKSFIRGQAVAVTATVARVKPAPKIASVRLRYRRVNQAETWQSVEMTGSSGNYRADIPAAYADSPYPLQYHFVIEPLAGATELHPGLRPGWQGQPYFVVRQTT